MIFPSLNLTSGNHDPWLIRWYKHADEVHSYVSLHERQLFKSRHLATTRNLYPLANVYITMENHIF